MTRALLPHLLARSGTPMRAPARGTRCAASQRERAGH
jgi:hypothetical protein